MTLRPALLAVAALAAALGTCLALNRWGPGGNGGLLGIVTEATRGEELAPHIEAGRRRDEAKRALAAEVVAGRMTLREAAERFRRLDPPDLVYPTGLPCPPRDERFFCGRVLDFVREILGREGRYTAGTRWYAEVFAAHPHLLAGPPAGQRYYAACAAAMAGCGQGRDAADLDEQSRAGFRRQALEWLRDELEAQRRLLEREPAQEPWMIAGGLERWLRDPYLAGAREADALARLPEAERQAWQKLWTDIADTLARAVDRLPR
jgi:hypothetical protein